MASLDDITCTGRRRRRRGGPVKNPPPGLDGHREGLASGPEGRRPVRWGSTTPGSPHAGSCLRPWREAALPADGAGTRVREFECTSHTVRAAGHFHVTGGHGCPSAAAVRQGHPSPRSPEPPREIPRNPKDPGSGQGHPSPRIPKDPQGSRETTGSPLRPRGSNLAPLLPSPSPSLSLLLSPPSLCRSVHPRAFRVGFTGHVGVRSRDTPRAARVTPRRSFGPARPGSPHPFSRTTDARAGSPLLETLRRVRPSPPAVAPPGSPPRTSVTGSGRPRRGPRGFSPGPYRV